MATATLNRLSRQAGLVARLERVVYSQAFRFTCSKLQLLFRKFFTFSKTCLIIKPNRPNSDKLVRYSYIILNLSFIHSFIEF